MLGLRLKNVSKRFFTPGGAQINALGETSIDIAPSEFVIVVGPNGSGKSTFLNIIAGNVLTDTGAIYAKMDSREREWTTTPARARGRFIARMHQDPNIGSIEDLSVLENLRLSSFGGLPSPFVPSIMERNRTLLMASIGQTPLKGKQDSLANELSHGQRQLLSLEMAASRRAKLFLLDEHTASLDRTNAKETMRRTEELCRRLKSTTIMITHDMLLAKQYGDRLLIFHDGQVRYDISGEKKRELSVADILQLSGFDESANGGEK